MVEPRLVIAHGAALKTGTGEEASMLLLVSGESVPLNALAAAALSLCDGTRSAADIAGAVSNSVAQQNVLEFLGAALTLGWIVTPSSGH